jgi:hypothetical protein
MKIIFLKIILTSTYKNNSKILNIKLIFNQKKSILFGTKFQTSPEPMKAILVPAG